MNASGNKPSDMPRWEDIGRPPLHPEPSWEYSYVGMRLDAPACFLLKLHRKLLRYLMMSVEKECPRCGEKMVVINNHVWRMTGAGLICELCAGAKYGSIVAEDNLEILRIGKNYEPILPERAHRFYEELGDKRAKDRVEFLREIERHQQETPSNDE